AKPIILLDHENHVSIRCSSSSSGRWLRHSSSESCGEKWLRTTSTYSAPCRKAVHPRRQPSIRSCASLRNQNKHALYEGDRLIRQFADPLTPVQSQILQLLSIPTAAYGPGK